MLQKIGGRLTCVAHARLCGSPAYWAAVSPTPARYYLPASPSAGPGVRAAAKQRAPVPLQAAYVIETGSGDRQTGIRVFLRVSSFPLGFPFALALSYFLSQLPASDLWRLQAQCHDRPRPCVDSATRSQERGEERILPHSCRKQAALQTTCVRTSSLQSCDGVNLCRLSHPTCSTLLQKPQEMNSTPSSSFPTGGPSVLQVLPGQEKVPVIEGARLGIRCPTFLAPISSSRRPRRGP